MYVKRTAELQRVKIEDAPREEKLAFFINVYNALVIHAFVAVGPPANMWQWYKVVVFYIFLLILKCLLFLFFLCVLMKRFWACKACVLNFYHSSCLLFKLTQFKVCFFAKIQQGLRCAIWSISTCDSLSVSTQINRI